MKIRMMLIIGVVVLFQSCKNEQHVDLGRALDITISLESEQLTEGIPNFLSLSMKNTSDCVVKVPDDDLIIEFTSYSGSIKRIIPLREISNDVSDLTSLSDLNLKSGEERIARIELGNLVFGALQNSDKKLPADDYTINVFLTAETCKQEVKFANNIRSNYLDVSIYD